MVNSAAQALKGHDYAAANRRALSHHFEEYDRARAERDAAEERLNRFAETIKLMMEGLPPGERQDYQRRFEELRDRAPVQNRGGAVYANVVELFKSHPPRPWNAAEIQDALEKEGKAAPDTKAIHNTLTYLARAGHI